MTSNLSGGEIARRRSARELAALFAEVRAAYPATPWRAPHRPAAVNCLLDLIVEHYRAGLSFEQIAARIGTSRSTVDTEIRRARETGVWPVDCRRRPERKEAGHADR